MDMACTVGTRPACSDSRQSAAYQNVGKQLGVWSWAISVKAGRLAGPLRVGPRATLNSARVRRLACCSRLNKCPILTFPTVHHVFNAQSIVNLIVASSRVAHEVTSVLRRCSACISSRVA
jgi:hypothetical protein